MKSTREKIEEILSGVDNVETKTIYKHSWDYVKRLESIVSSAVELAEALEFYASEETYFKVTPTVRERPIGKDCGKLAIEALEKFTKTIEGE